MSKALKIIVPIIILLTIVAALGGLWPAEGSPYETLNFRGERIIVNARGLYYWDTLSSAAQMQANDLVALVIGVPLLLVGYFATLRGSLRGRLLLAGSLGFVLYTYLTMCVGAAFNPLFLIYVALFSLSLWAFVMSLMGVKIDELPTRFKESLPRKSVAALLIFAAAFLGLAWLGRIAAAMKPGAVPELENATSMFIQAMDLGLVAPACVVAAVLLLKRRPWGYLLASVGMVKFLTLGLAVSLMGLNMVRVGVDPGLPMLVIFIGMALANLVLTALMLAAVKPAGKAD
jgi:hypothetical protein